MEIGGYEAAFKRELIEFADCMSSGRTPRTPGIDGLRDVALCQAIVEAHLTGAPVADPTALVRDVSLVGSTAGLVTQGPRSA